MESQGGAAALTLQLLDPKTSVTGGRACRDQIEVRVSASSTTLNHDYMIIESGFGKLNHRHAFLSNFLPSCETSHTGGRACRDLKVAPSKLNTSAMLSDLESNSDLNTTNLIK
jgi:hypothetical protein